MFFSVVMILKGLEFMLLELSQMQDFLSMLLVLEFMQVMMQVVHQ
jgi:hypothetical protein